MNAKILLIICGIAIAQIAFALDKAVKSADTFKDDPSDVRKQDLDQALMKAATFGKEEMLEALISQGANVNATFEQAHTPLMGAAANGFPKIMKHLLAAGANVNSRSSGNYTALHYAATSGELESVRVLLEAGADPNVTSDAKTTALSYAVDQKDLKTIDLLKSVGVEPNDREEFLIAALEGDQVLVEKWVNKGADINEKGRGRSRVLEYVAHGGHIEIIKFLLAKGAEVDAQNIGWVSNVANASKLQVFRVSSDRKKIEDLKNQNQRIDIYPIISEAKEPGNSFIERAKSLLFKTLYGGYKSHRSWQRRIDEKGSLYWRGYGTSKGCHFSPGVALRFWNDEENVDILICYSCMDFRILSKNMERYIQTEFPKSPFVELAKEAFPDDPVIQKLK